MKRTSIDTLSPQQRRCLEAVAQGRSTPEIAFDLGIAESTVNGHIEAAVRKIGAPNRRRAAFMLTAQQAAPPPEKLPGEILPVDETTSTVARNPPSRVEEERISFLPEPAAWEEIEADDGGTMHPLHVLGWVVLIAASLCLLLLALDPLAQSASKLANQIQSPT